MIQIKPQRPVFYVYGEAAQVAEVMTWLAGQTTTARVEDFQSMRQGFNPLWSFNVSFETDKDEVAFKMFHTEAFEAGVDPSASETINGTYRIGVW